MTFAIVPIDAETADGLRATATVFRTADEAPGYPCRQCLRDAELGEELILVSHDPFLTDPTLADVPSPYRCTSPIYLHREPCADRRDDARVPAQLVRRHLSVRGFDDAAMMRSASVVAGSSLAEELERVLADPTIERVHVHNAGAGCFAALVTRD